MAIGKKYDVLVSGGGIAGMSCAITLLKKGKKVLVIDKQKFPRFKLCGGMLTNKSYREYEKLLGGSEEIKKSIVDETNIFSIYNGYSLVAESKPTNIPFRIVDREKFDNNLIEYYKNGNGEIIENCEIKELLEKKVKLSNGEIVEYDNIVVAEGAISSTRKKLDIDYNYLGFCLETCININDIKEKYRSKKISIFFNVLNKGYAWIFPYSDKVKVGFGNTYNKDIDYNNEFKKYIENISNKKIEELEIKGAFIPFGKCIDYQKENVYLIGDSGGYVDPIYGEGIYFAVKTGTKIAEAIINGKDANILLTDIKKIIEGGFKKQKLLFNSFISKIFFMFINKKAKFLKFYADNMVQEYNYTYDNLFAFGVDYEKNKNMVN